MANALKVAPVLGPDFNISSPYGYVIGANREGSCFLGTSGKNKERFTNVIKAKF